MFCGTHIHMHSNTILARVYSFNWSVAMCALRYFAHILNEQRRRCNNGVHTIAIEADIVLSILDQRLRNQNVRSIFGLLIDFIRSHSCKPQLQQNIFDASNIIFIQKYGEKSRWTIKFLDSLLDDEIQIEKMEFHLGRDKKN